NALISWLTHDDHILIVPVAALKRILPPIDYWKQFQLNYKLGEVIDIENDLNMMVKMGYERVDMVTNQAEFSMRGGIIDIYPITESNPIRIELFDDEVDSIRYFDLVTQRSLEKMNQMTIKPTSELLLLEEDISRTADRLEIGLSNALSRMQDAKAKTLLHQNINGESELLRANETFQDLYKYNRYFYEKPASLLDYLGDDGLIILDQIGRIQETAEQLDQE